MSKDLFGGLGNLGNLGGIFGDIAKNVVPKDTPEGKLLAAQSELFNLQNQESEVLLEIGRQAYEQNPSAWAQDGKLQLIRQNIAAAKAALDEANTTQKQADAANATQEQANAAKAAEDAKGRCPSCGYKNADGLKFCQECGTALGAPAKAFCTSCGAELAVGTRFCGECGAKQGDA